MRLSNRRIVRSLTCLTVLLVCASAPLAAQQGIDLLDAEQVLGRAAPGAKPAEAKTTVRVSLSDDPERVVLATHDQETYKYDDGDFENYEDTYNPFNALEPYATEYAQRFNLRRSGTVVSVHVCFDRPDNVATRSVAFDVVFYGDDEDRNDNPIPGRRSPLRYQPESTISQRGGQRCINVGSAVAGKTLRRGAHWIGIAVERSINKRLGEDQYTTDDPLPTDSDDIETELATRTRQDEDDDWGDWMAHGAGTRRTIKAYGIRMVVDHSDHTTPTPDPGPDPTPDPGPAPAMTCSGGTCQLEDGRFRVRTRYVLAGMPGQTAEGTMSGGAGLFTFGGDDPELLVRMVDDCGGSGYWMLYAGAATDADYAIAIRDTMSNTLRWFRARAGGSIRDMAFACAN
ncbi:MAG: hypothetical protein OXG83_16815 [Acidobacteria bacterium]|nr:hypothetical protein [Acidobacteriota bacterium]